MTTTSGVISEAAATVAQLAKPKGRKGNGGDPHTLSESFASVVENQAYVGPKGLLKQVDELKTDLNIARKREKEAMALCAAISKVRQERMLKEGEKEMVSKAIKGMEEREDRMVSELLALEMGMGQPGLPFGEAEEKKEKPGKDAWRKVKLEEVLGAKTGPKLLAKLKDGFVKGKNDAANLQTLGDLVDFQKRNRLSDIKGIGPGAAEKIEAVAERWWAEHPEMVPAKEETKDAKAETKAAPDETESGKAETPTFLTPADLNLTAEQLDELCQPHLLVSAPYDPHEKIPDLHGCVLYQDRKWVVMGAMLGEKEDVYYIRPLLVGQSIIKSPDKSDPYCGRLVRLDGAIMELGAMNDELLVKIAAEETVPLNQAMGKVKKRKRKAN